MSQGVLGCVFSSIFLWGVNVSTIFDFVGTHSTGKTTVMNAVAKELISTGASVEIIESVTRKAIETEGFHLYDKTESNQQVNVSWFNWGEILASEASVVLSTAFGIRSLAYTLAAPNVSQRVKDLHWSYVRFFAASPNVCWIYVPVNFPMVEDGVRKVDDAYRFEVDKYIVDIFTTLKIPFRTISGTRTEMKDKAIDIICTVVGGYAL